MDPFQEDVARLALDVAARHGFALAGGNALAAHGLVDRPTEDVDLFSPEPGSPGSVAEAVRSALEQAGYEVQVARAPETTNGEFAQFLVSRGGHEARLDLARDWRQRPPVRLSPGPVLHMDDAVGSKVGAMVGRGLPRDFIDVAAVVDRYSREQLMRLAFVRDPGLRVVDFTDALRRLDRLPAGDFARYGMDDEAVSDLRNRFSGWPRDPDEDAEGHAVHEAVAAEQAARLAGQALTPPPPAGLPPAPSSSSAHGPSSGRPPYRSR